jgi:hypothetical protein
VTARRLVRRIADNRKVLFNWLLALGFSKQRILDYVEAHRKNAREELIP